MQKSARLAIACLLFLSGITAANPQDEILQVWNRLESAPFTVYTSGDPSNAVNAFEQLEAARAFVQSNHTIRRIPDVDVIAVIFDGREDFSRYEPHPRTFAFYRRRHSVNYIVARSACGGPARALAHEYIHAVFANISPKLPLWLAEGLAEVYSEARRDGDTLSFGMAVPEHVARLRIIPAGELPAAFSATAETVYADGNRVWDFYALSWAAAHTLSQEPKYSGRLADFVLATNESGTEQGLRSIYGVSIGEFTSDVERHIKRAVWGSSGRVLASRVKPAYSIGVASELEISEVLAAVRRVTSGSTPGSLTFPAYPLSEKH